MFCVTGIQEGTECTRCKNDWALRAAIALLYVLCALLTIAVAVLGYKGECHLLHSHETNKPETKNVKTTTTTATVLQLSRRAVGTVLPLRCPRHTGAHAILMPCL